MMSVFAFLAALLAQTSSGAAPWEVQPFAADPRAVLKAAAAIPAPSDANVHILFEKCHYTIDPDGRVTFELYRAFRVLTPAGAKDWDTLEDDWAPWHENRPILTARVISPDGAVHVLDPKTIEETSARENDSQLHGDRRELRAPLPGIAPGAVVEERMVDQDSAPSLAGGGVARRMWFALGVPVHHSQLIVDAPREMSLRWIARPTALGKPMRTEANGRVSLTFDHGAEAAIEEIDEGLPHDSARAPYIGFSTGRSWHDTAVAYERVVDAQIAGADLSALTAGVSGSRDGVVAQLLARLHKTIRYTGIEFAEASIVPRKPAETLTRRYGDCKDQAALLVAMLRAQKIPAHVALLDAGAGLDLDAELPGFNVFNHAIVFIPGDHPIWIDPTDEFARAGELPTADQGHYALVAASSSTGLIRTPVALAAENRIVESREVLLAERGPAHITEVTRFWGAFERRVRDMYADTQRKKIDEILDKYVKNEYRAKKLERWTNGDPSDLSRPFEIKVDVSDAGRGTSTMIDAAVGLPLWFIWQELPSTLKPNDEDEGAKPDRNKRKVRTVDFEIDRPFVYEVHWHIVPPAGFSARPLPPDESQSIGPARLSRHAAAAANGTIDAVDRFELAKRRLTPAEIDEFRTSLSKLNKQRMRLITFDQIGQAHLTAGRVREALAEFRRLATLHPKESLHHAQLARALLSGGLGDAARTEARRAIEIEPSSAWAHITLGYVLQHDALGRAYRDGWDRAGAIAAFRKAKQLDPDDVGIRADLARLLEYNEEGERYGDGASFGEAIAEYRGLRKDTNNHKYDSDLLTSLLWAGRWKEVRALVAEMSPSPLGREADLVAVAALEGAPSAIKHANVIPDADERRTALKGAAVSLLRMRRYDLCPPLFLEATAGSPEAAQLRQQAETMKKVRRYEASGEPRDPTAVVSRMMALTLEGGSVDRISALFARDAKPDLRSDMSENELFKLRRKMRRDLQKVGMPIPVVVDIALSVMQSHVSGDDRTGWRVSLEAMSNKFQFYLVREGGAYRIRAAAGDDLGREALHRIQSGDMTGARQWLDWARQDLPSVGTVDDPVSTRAFMRLYHKGGDAGRDALEIAAASLIAESKRPAEAVPALEHCRAKGGPEGEPCTMALATAYGHLGRWQDEATAAESLAAQHPDSTTAFLMRAEALGSLGRWPDLVRIAEERVHRSPDDVVAQRVLAKAMTGRGDLAAAVKITRKTIDAGQAEANDFNQAAWYSLFVAGSKDKALEDARRAVQMSHDAPQPLHTLATLYAERGSVQEARETILKAIDANEGDPRSDDWYVLGRIAEQFEVRDAALAAYEKVQKRTGEPEAISTWKLAQTRIAALRK